MKILMKSAIGSEPTADAPADEPSNGTAVSLVPTAAAAHTARAEAEESRRATATADHASPATASEPSPASQDANRTDTFGAETADAGNAVITGTSATTRATDSDRVVTDRDGEATDTAADARGTSSIVDSRARVASTSTVSPPTLGPRNCRGLRVADPSRESDRVPMPTEEVEPRPPAGEPDPAEPAEPEVSAAANGTDTTAAPTPNATANAPTRPTHRALRSTAPADVTGTSKPRLADSSCRPIWEPPQ